MNVVILNRVHVAMIVALTLAAERQSLAGNAPPAPAATQPSTMPDNTWVAANIDFKAALAGYGQPLDAWMTSDGYSDSALRAKTGNVLIRTGVVSKKLGIYPGFYTNTTVEWDLKTDTARIVDVANWGGGSYGGADPLPTYKEHATPNPRHTYDGICYVPEEDSLYMLFGAYMRMINEKATPQGKAIVESEKDNTWKFSFATSRWTRIDGSPKKLGLPIRSIYETHLAHWPEGKKLLFLDSGGGNGAEFDLAAGQWKAAPAANKPGMSLYHARSTWDSKRSLWVFRKGPDVCTYDPKERKFEKLPDCWDLGISPEERLKNGSADKPADKRLNWKGICYISKYDSYLVTGPTGDDTMVYHVGQKKWRSVKGGAAELPNGYCQYNQELDLVALNFQLQCFKFRYVPAEE